MGRSHPGGILQEPPHCLQVWRKNAVQMFNLLHCILVCVRLLVKKKTLVQVCILDALHVTFPTCIHHARSRELNCLLKAHHRAGPRWSFVVKVCMYAHNFFWNWVMVLLEKILFCALESCGLLWSCLNMDLGVSKMVYNDPLYLHYHQNLNFSLVEERKPDIALMTWGVKNEFNKIHLPKLRCQDCTSLFYCSRFYARSRSKLDRGYNEHEVGSCDSLYMYLKN